MVTNLNYSGIYFFLNVKCTDSTLKFLQKSEYTILTLKHRETRGYKGTPRGHTTCALHGNQHNLTLEFIFISPTCTDIIKLLS